MELINLDPDVKVQLTKLVSVRLCPPVTGQALLDLVVNPPQPDEPSYPTYKKVRLLVCHASVVHWCSVLFICGTNLKTVCSTTGTSRCASCPG